MTKELLAALASVLTPILVAASTTTIDGITWTYYIKDGKACVGGGSSSSPAVSTSTTGAITIPSKLGGYPVMYIGNYAFYHCSGLTHVAIPDGVTSIGSSAFSGCSGLTSVEIRDSVTSIGDGAFYGCSGLTDVTIPGSVISIGRYAFSDCNGLMSVTILDCVSSISIGDRAFSGCSGLTKVTIPNRASVYSSAFSGCVNVREATVPGSKCNIPFDNVTNLVISTGVTSIGADAFNGCSELMSVMIPGSVTSIGGRAFYGCSGLTSVTIPDSVTNIWDYAFHGCSGLTNVTIPDSVMNIGDYAFYGCCWLTNVTIGNGVTSIGNHAFVGCGSLTSMTISQYVCSMGIWYLFPSAYHSITNIVISDNVTSIANSAFAHCSGLTSITIPNRVETIGDGAFSSCSSLTNMVIPEGVISIGSYALSGCSRLTSVRIPNSVMSIGDYAFSSCGLLSIAVCDDNVYYSSDNGLLLTKDGKTLLQGVNGDVVIPNSVTNIETGAFSGCNELTSVTIPNSVMHIKDNAFSNCSNIVLVTIPQSVCSSRMTKIFPAAYQTITDVVIVDGVTSMGNSLFVGCAGLEHITIPDSVANIGIAAFSGCHRLTSIILPSNMTTIRNSTFADCSGLTSITVPDSVSAIESAAFWACSGLTNMAISASVTNIENGAFAYCNGLVEIDVDENNVTYSSMNGLLLSKDGKTLVQGINGEVSVPSCVTKIGNSAFYGCTGLNGITIPNGITSIGNYAFYGCSGLTSVTIPNSISSIGDEAFLYCNNLSTVYLPSGFAVTAETFPPSAAVIYYKEYQWATFDVLDGTVVPTQVKVRFGAEYGALPEPTRNGYRFESWTYGGQDVFSNTIVTACDNHFLVAKWTPNKYLMTFDADGGIGGDQWKQDCGTVLIAPNVSRVGYRLTGWSPAMPDTVPAYDATYTAQWQINTHTVTFDANGGVGGWREVRDYGTAIVAPTVTRTGYDFAGWSPEMAATVPDNDVTYTAQWTPKKYQIVFDANGGVGGWSEARDYNSAIVAPVVSRVGYTFTEWSPAVPATVPANDATYTAQWQINTHTVTFDANGGTGGRSGTQDYGTTIVVPTVTRTGYDFTGWLPEVAATVPDNDVTYTAQWTPKKYQIAFDANGGIGGWSEARDYDSALAAPVVSRVGYTFTGWSPAVPATVPANDATYTAQWQINTHTVTFDANGGTGGRSGTQDYGTTIVVPTVTRTGYNFTGWVPEVAATVPDNDVTYTAQWTPKKYHITFDANGGIGGWGEARDYDSALVAPEVSRVGYTFTGWSPTVPATVPANDATYTAQWQVNTHTVTFDANGGTGGWSEVRDYGTAIVAPTVTRTGYNFTGWSPEAATTVPDEDVSYTAQWEANTYTVSFDSNGGNLNGGAASKDVVFDSVYGELPTPVLEFRTFDGWILGGAVVVPSTKVATAANHTLVAKWSRWGARISPFAVSSGQTLRELYPDDYANLTTVVLEEGVAELPEGFFSGCDNVENLTLPESLETLGYDELPKKIRESLDYGSDGFMVYQGWVLGYRDDGASSLTLPQGVKGIGTRAFAEFWDLETVVIPDTVKRIGHSAFFECTFLDEVEIPNSVETIGERAFENCSYMQTLTVGNGVRKVANRAFARCASLQAVSFADGLESVGECAFSNDWRMLSVSLPHSVTNIGDGAFAACRRVKGVAVPANVMTLSDMFPAAYTNIESVVVASGETDIMDDMFNGCEAIVDFTWSGSETNVGERAFLGCEALEAVAMPDSVLSIGAEAFKKCSSLHDLTLSRSLSALPDYAFAQCGSLDSFIVPASVTSLGECVVEDSAVSAIYYLGNAPEYDPNAYTNAAAGLVTYVVRGTRGWDGTPSSRVLPEDWIGHEITYWTPNRFDVTFDANGGYFGESSVTQWAEQQITDMGYVLPNQNPVRPGYAFEGWWTESIAGAQVKYSTQVTATRPHSLYAHWRLLGNLVTATFNANGGTVVIPGSQSYVAGQTFGEFPVPSRRGYVFCGWWTAATGGDRVVESSAVPSADIELFAHWEPIRYFVAYDANGGTGSMTNQVHVYDSSKALDGNLFSRTGYAFSGWARSGDGQVEYMDRAEVVNLAEISNAVVTLYAVWSGAGYNVRFDANGGTGVMENQTIQIGETQNLHTNAFAFSGREFLGWATESGGTVAYRDGEAVSGLASANGATVHLYAVWRTSDATWRVSFDGNGGSVAPRHWNVVRGESLDALPTPTRPGHAFMGWWTRSAGGASVTPPFVVTGDMSLYAHWRAYDDPLPPVSGDTGVAAVMGDSADLRLAENVKTVAEYDALVEWADANGIGHQAVRTSLHVWASYVLGTGALLENEPEIVIGEVGIREDGALGATHPSVTVSVIVKDGGEAIAVDAVKVASMFEATSDLDDWDGAAKLPVSAEAVETANVGNGYSMRFQMTLPAVAERAFLRIRR